MRRGHFKITAELMNASYLFDETLENSSPLYICYFGTLNNKPRFSKFTK